MASDNRERVIAALKDTPLDLCCMADALMPVLAAVREEARREALEEAMKAIEADASRMYPHARSGHVRSVEILHALTAKETTNV